VTDPDERSRVLVLANPQAGGTDVADEAVRLLQERSDAVVVHPGSDEQLAHALRSADGRRVVVVGGDGTVHAVAQSLHDLGLLREVGPIALVPAGTGNDLARTLGLPLDDVPTAVALALGSNGRDVELLVDGSGGVVVNAVHVGIGAEAGALAARAKEHLGKVGLGRVAYPAGAIAAGVTHTAGELRVSVDGRVLHEGPTLLVAAGIGTSVGGGTPLSPDADPFDGVIDVTVSTATGTVTRLGYAASLRAGTHVDRDDTVTAQGRELLVESIDDETFEANADGEITTGLRTRRWTVVPRAWHLVVPPTTPGYGIPLGVGVSAPS
jgi:diacylglycerol kinase family enzyme